MINTMEKVYSDLDEMQVEIFDCPMRGSVSISSPDGYIGLNTSVGYTSSTLCTVLMHEAGHFISGSFYYGYSPFELRSAAEARACRAAIERYIPYEALQNCFLSGITEVWELAEYFGVHDYMIRCAHHYYMQVLGLTF